MFTYLENQTAAFQHGGEEGLPRGCGPPLLHRPQFISGSVSSLSIYLGSELLKKSMMMWGLDGCHQAGARAHSQGAEEYPGTMRNWTKTTLFSRKWTTTHNNSNSAGEPKPLDEGAEEPRGCLQDSNPAAFCGPSVHSKPTGSRLLSRVPPLFIEH